MAESCIQEQNQTTLASRMGVEFIVNEDSRVWLLHDQPFAAILQWAEYDRELNALNIMTDDGMVHPLGMTIPQRVGELLCSAKEMCAIYMKDGQTMHDIGIIPVMVRETYL